VFGPVLEVGKSKMAGESLGSHESRRSDGQGTDDALFRTTHETLQKFDVVEDGLGVVVVVALPAMGFLTGAALGPRGNQLLKARVARWHGFGGWFFTITITKKERSISLIVPFFPPFPSSFFTKEWKLTLTPEAISSTRLASPLKIYLADSISLDTTHFLCVTLKMDTGSE
jgi:hypothetical protein